jgi:hypothetical protein
MGRSKRTTTPAAGRQPPTRRPTSKRSARMIAGPIIRRRRTMVTSASSGGTLSRADVATRIHHARIWRRKNFEDFKFVRGARSPRRAGLSSDCGHSGVASGFAAYGLTPRTGDLYRKTCARLTFRSSVLFPVTAAMRRHRPCEHKTRKERPGFIRRRRQ